MKKKLLLLIFVVLFALSAASCGGPEDTIRDIAGNIADAIDNNGEATEKATEATTVKIEETTKETEAATDPVKSKGVSSDWFDDAVFVGDSITLKLSYYCADRPKALGKAQFLCAGSLGYTNSLWSIHAKNNVHPSYKGKKCLTQYCAKKTGATKVFVMLGMNDMAMYGVKKTVKNADKLLNKIKKTSPKATIYVQSVTPILRGKEKGDFNNIRVKEMNNALKKYCKQKGIKFLNVYSIFADKSGFLPKRYCGDPDAMGIHFTEAACEKWIQYLKENVK